MSRRRKKHKHDDEHVDESWLVPYADILTLLLALFIVLFASSSVDAQKFQLISKAFNNVFTGGTGIFEYPSPLPNGEKESIDKEDNKGEGPTKEQEKVPSSTNQSYLDHQELKQVQNKVNSYIKENELTDKFTTSLTDEGLLVSINDNVLFNSGSAEVRTMDLHLANEISELLVMDPPRDIIISGHTDNVPIHNAKFDSNWELSVMRAINFMKIILKNKELDPKTFSAKGYGEFQPVASNKTAEGKAKNRRVEILILPRTAPIQ